MHVITDSQVIMRTGKKLAEVATGERVANQALWAALTSIQRQGYNMQYHWMERMQLEANWAADQLAGKSRLALKELQLTDGHAPLSIHDLHIGTPEV